jgi:hypothetical protein
LQATDVSLPAELMQLRQWLEAVFEQARQGLPWPEQVALRAVECAFTAGVFGSALVAAWRLEAMHKRTGSGAVPQALSAVSRSLETCAFGPLGPAITKAWQELEATVPHMALTFAEATQRLSPQPPSRSGTPRVVR